MRPSAGQGQAPGQAARDRPLGAAPALACTDATDARVVVLLALGSVASSTVGGTSGCESHIGVATCAGAAKLVACVLGSGLTVSLRLPARFGVEATIRVITTAVSAASAVTHQ